MEETGGGEWEVGPDEVVLPDALEEVGAGVFYRYFKIKVIWVGNSFVAKSLKSYYQHDSVIILPARSTMVGNKFLWDLRKLRDVVIPEGVQEIGEQWFRDTEVESVIIPASAKKIGNWAFWACTRLKNI